MKIVIAGAGDVGFHLAKLLSHESHDIILVDSESKHLDYADSHIDVLTIRGDATSPAILKKAKVDSADLLIAVTSSESINMLVAMMGKRFGAKKTIARISNTELKGEEIDVNFKAMGIDNMMSPEELAAKEIRRLIKRTSLTDSFEFGQGHLQLVGVHLDNSNAPVVDKTVAQTVAEFPDIQFSTIAIKRGQESIIPRGESTFRIGDHAYFITRRGGFDQIAQLAGKQDADIGSITILGGSRIGFHVANALQNDYSVKLIEERPKHCFRLAQQLKDTLVIQGDGRNVELLREEEIEHTDCFVAVTGNSETNIMACLAAKGQGVKKTIALVENIDYINLSQNIGIDTLINKKLIAASSIFRYLRKGEVINITNVHGVEAEVLEFEVKEKSKISRKMIKDLDFPRTATVGGIVRDDRGWIPRGDFQIKPGDHVVVFCLRSAIKKVEKFFK